MNPDSPLARDLEALEERDVDGQQRRRLDVPLEQWPQHRRLRELAKALAEERAS
jgi:hypothetical protein